MGGAMSTIVISGDTSGTITLDAPAVAGTNTLMLPAVTGTILTTASGSQSVPRAALPAGSVLQVVQTVKTNTFSTSSGSPVDITGLSVSITPTASTSKILVMMDIGVVGTQSAATGNFYIVRNSTIVGNGAGATNNISAGVYQNTSNAFYDALSFTFLDSPATTSATTYKVQVSSDTATVFIGRRAADTFVGGACTITVMEIAA
jgi:hypothetical protein